MRLKKITKHKHTGRLVKDLTGKKFGRLTVIKRYGRANCGRIKWLCRCICGKTTKVMGVHLLSGHTASCECYAVERRKEALSKDLTGKIFGRLTAIKSDGSDRFGNVVWVCRCICGNVVKVNCACLCRGSTISCGCYRSELNTTHGMSGTTEHKLWYSAKRRAKVIGLKFTLKVSDIKIPPTCPILHIPMMANKISVKNNSPTLDRINPLFGYTKENSCVISHRANSLKNNATEEELESILNYVKSNGFRATRKEPSVEM